LAKIDSQHQRYQLLSHHTRPAKGKHALVVFRQAFAELPTSHHRVRGDGPAVRAVRVLDVRAEFAKRWTTGEGDSKKKADAIRNAFKRAVEFARKDGFAFESTADDELVWLAREPQPNPNAAHRFEPVPGKDGEFYLHQMPEKPAPAAQAGIPFMMTSAMKVTLRDLGYSDEAIANMTPAVAHEIINAEPGDEYYNYAADPSDAADATDFDGRVHENPQNPT
jgi:hypothetical protein